MFWITKTVDRNRHRMELAELLNCVGTGLEARQLKQGRVGRWGRGRFDSSLLEKKWGHGVSG